MIHLLISATQKAADSFTAEGARRDFRELARLTGGTLVYQDGRGRCGLTGKLFGPHMRQAWSDGGWQRTTRT